MESVLVTAGILALVGAAVGGGLELAGNKLPVIGSTGRQIVLAALGAVFLALGLGIIAVGGDNGGNGSTGTTAGPGTTGGPGTTSGTETTGRPGTTAGPVDGCVVTISNPLATLHEEPDEFSQEIGSIPSGDYVVEGVEIVSFGPQQQRWLRIEVDGRSGFVRDSTFNIADRTADCP